MGFKSTVQAHGSSLTASEQRVASVLLSDPYKTSAWTAAQVAEAIGAHESTVTRFAQKLGYRGYGELRADLHLDARPSAGSADRARARAAHSHELERLAQDEIQAIANLPDHIDQDSLDRAAKAMFDARRVYIFGANHATTLVEFMDRRLRRIGMDVVPLRHQGRDLAERVLTMGADDVVLAFAFKEPPVGLSEVLRQAQEVGSSSILVTDPPGLLIRPQPTHVLAAARGADEDFHTLVVPLVVCYALQLAITNLDPERFGAAMARVDALSRTYSAPDLGDDFGAPTRS